MSQIISNLSIYSFKTEFNKVLPLNEECYEKLGEELLIYLFSTNSGIEFYDDILKNYND